MTRFIENDEIIPDGREQKRTGLFNRPEITRTMWTDGKDTLIIHTTIALRTGQEIRHNEKWTISPQEHMVIEIQEKSAWRTADSRYI